MAKSQSHKLGEFIGSFFEELMKRPLRMFAVKHGLYFDVAGERKARPSKKLTWTDINGSQHDLDFVLERGGTEQSIGEPVAFIELAWRRYTRHSKNKVQEISGAVNPICEKYRLTQPFKGAILCGQFTKNALEQLVNDNFHVLYIPFDRFVEAFRTHGFDIYFDDDSNEREIKQKYKVVSQDASEEKLEDVRATLLNTFRQEIERFLSDLSASCTRRIKTICILPLHGTQTNVSGVDEAIAFINNYSMIPDDSKLEYIEVIVTYTTGSVIRCQFKTKEEAIIFLRGIS